MIKLANLLETNLDESVYDKGIFKAVFFSGLPGSGKSYTISKITDGTIEPRIVNTDRYTEYVAKKIGLNTSMRYVGELVDQYLIDKTENVTISQLSGYINSMLPLFVDSTSNKINRTLYREGVLSSFGYDTAMVYVKTSLETAVKRMQQRDRYVPIPFIKEVYKSMRENVEFYRNRFKIFLEVNNEEGELNDEALLKTYKTISSFFKDDIKNPIGRNNKKEAEETSGYLTPSVYSSISEIKSKLINWY